MDEMNVPQTDAIVITAELLPPITAKTTLGEVIEMLRLGERPAKTPGTKILRMSSEPIADMNGCTLFRNGFAIYENASGRTVVWLPYCTSFTYYFNKLRDSEKDTLSETYELPEGFLETQPWVIGVTLIGDHRVEANVMNRNGSRVGSTDFDSSDLDDCDDEETEAIKEKNDPLRREFNWYDGRMAESPLDALIRKEARREMLAAMSEKQREAFILYYKQSLISLTEFEKMMGKKKFAELLGEYVAKPPGKLALVPESDPREPVDLTATPAQEFIALPDEE